MWFALDKQQAFLYGYFPLPFFYLYKTYNEKVQQMQIQRLQPANGTKVTAPFTCAM